MGIITAPVRRSYGDGQSSQYTLAAATTVYDGQAVGFSALGSVEQLTAAHTFIGFAFNTVPAARGGVSGGEVTVQHAGTIRLTVTGLVAASAGRPVYATDSNTFTLTPGGVLIGTVSHVINAVTDEAVVAFDALGNVANRGAPARATFVIADEDTNAIAVTATVRDAFGALAANRMVHLRYVSDLAGSVTHATAVDGGIAVTTGALIATLTAGKHAIVRTDANGVVTATFTHAAGVLAGFAAVDLADGSTVVSAAVDFA